ncbi:hypothetical protein ACP70R_001037 [Stipagrostis hirtigluma subsp. patula]
MAGSKVLCTCILIFIIVSSQAEARHLMAATSNGKEGARTNGVVEADGSFRTMQEMATQTSTGQGGEEKPMTTTDSRPTAPGNSPGIGNKGKINN